MSPSPFEARFRPVGAEGESWSGLHGSARAIAIQAAAAAHDGITLVVMRSSHQAHLLARDLELLAISESPVWLFPDHETLPYDPFSAHPDIVSERLAALAAVVGMLAFSVWRTVTRYRHWSWELDETGWTPVPTDDAPPPRWGHRLAYDSERGVTVLFGGRNDGAIFGFLDANDDGDGELYVTSYATDTDQHEDPQQLSP